MRRSLVLLLLWIFAVGKSVACGKSDLSSETAVPTTGLHTSGNFEVSDQSPKDESKPVWSVSLGEAINVAPAVAGDFVIVATADGSIHSVDARTGSPSWRNKTDPHSFSRRRKPHYICRFRQ